MTARAEKIEKLLALANSPNPHEAALAAAKAKELMGKPESVCIADRGFKTARDFALCTEALVQDVLAERLSPKQANALARKWRRKFREATGLKI